MTLVINISTFLKSEWEVRVGNALFQRTLVFLAREVCFYISLEYIEIFLAYC